MNFFGGETKSPKCAGGRERAFLFAAFSAKSKEISSKSDCFWNYLISTFYTLLLRTENAPHVTSTFKFCAFPLVFNRKNEPNT